jgi:hypothetical protein
MRVGRCREGKEEVEKEEEEFKVEKDKRRNKEEFREKQARKVAKERNIRPWIGGRRCGNGRRRVLILYVGSATSLKMEKFALFVVTNYKK